MLGTVRRFKGTTPHPMDSDIRGVARLDVEGPSMKITIALLDCLAPLITEPERPTLILSSA